MISKNSPITIYTDGSCFPNPGPGGWAFLARSLKEKIHSDMGFGGNETTNNRMEMTAVIKALEWVEIAYDLSEYMGIVVVSDSQYVCRGFNEWMHGWARNDFCRGVSPIKNNDLWRILHSLNNKLNVKCRWVKGHNMNPDNEWCDSAAGQARIMGIRENASSVNQSKHSN